MRLFGHPVHLMLVHFPVALWPAHWAFHLAAGRLPAGLAGVAGFWLLAAGVVLGWLAALCGVLDLVQLARLPERQPLNRALAHAAVNGSVLVGFTVLLGWEWRLYPVIAPSGVRLTTESVLLVMLLGGNYLGGRLDWRRL